MPSSFFPLIENSDVSGDGGLGPDERKKSRTPTPTRTPTKTPTKIPTRTPAPTKTPTRTATPTASRTPSPTATPTLTPGVTATPTATGTAPASQRLVIDPITRIEGHLRLEVQVENGRVADAWSSGTSFRGMELVLKGRDPRDAWAFTQRICGV